jgi:hypothetical protein
MQSFEKPIARVGGNARSAGQRMAEDNAAIGGQFPHWCSSKGNAARRISSLARRVRVETFPERVDGVKGVPWKICAHDFWTRPVIRFFLKQVA